MWEISMMKIDCIVFLQVCYFVFGLADLSGMVRILPYQFIIFLYVMQYVILKTAKYFSEENVWTKCMNSTKQANGNSKSIDISAQKLIIKSLFEKESNMIYIHLLTTY